MAISLMEGVNVDKEIEMYCSPLESLKQSCIEMRLIREGKLPKKDWRVMFDEIEADDENIN